MALESMPPAAMKKKWQFQKPNISLFFKELLHGTENIVDRLVRVRKIMLVLTLSQFVASLVVLLFGLVGASRGEKMYRTILSGTVGMVSGLIGTLAAAKRLEFLARLFFIIQMWSLSTVTAHIYLAMDTNRLSQQLCNPRQNFASSNDTACKGRLETDATKIFFSFAAVVITVLSSMVSLDFNDVLNDFNAEFGEAEDEAADQIFEMEQKKRNAEVVAEEIEAKKDPTYKETLGIERDEHGEEKEVDAVREENAEAGKDDLPAFEKVEGSPVNAQSSPTQQQQSRSTPPGSQGGASGSVTASDHAMSPVIVGQQPYQPKSGLDEAEPEAEAGHLPPGAVVEE